MLALDSDRWGTLKHAYGRGSDVPQMLRSLESRKPSASSEIWGALCHQYSVYSATIAAIPHIVRVVRSFAPADQWDDVIFVGLVAAYANPELVASMETDIRDSYAAAIEEAAEMAVELVRSLNLGYEEFAYLLQAAAALHGCQKLGRSLSGFADQEFLLRCPKCKCELYLWPTNSGMTVAAEDPVTHKDTTRIDVEPCPELDEFAMLDSAFAPEDAFHWLTHLASDAHQDQLRQQLRSLFGTAQCPTCTRRFPEHREHRVNQDNPPHALERRTTCVLESGTSGRHPAMPPFMATTVSSTHTCFGKPQQLTHFGTGSGAG